MEGNCNDTCSVVPFGENSSSRLCPMMMMPLVTCTSPHPINSTLNNNPNADHTNTLFLPNNHNTGLGYFMEIHNNNNNHGTSSSSSSPVKAKIMAHPHYQRLLAAYVNCQKQVGAPPEVVARLEEACASIVSVAGNAAGSAYIGEDPALDQFMEAYCEMLIKYEQKLSKPFKEAMLFLQRMESQFKSLTIFSKGYLFGQL